jgi:hypothetical protein
LPFFTTDERLVHLGGELIEHQVPEPGVEQRGKEEGGEGEMPGSGASETTTARARPGWSAAATA